tara:strand:+ start:241 stop:534 length:294 start_codon:yes stop_codon:yes gene_type:complete
MLNYHFNSKLISTEQLLKELNITISNLNYWKTQWRKVGNDDWDMGLRIIGRRALWDPILFLDWLYTNKVKNKSKDQRDINLVAFVSRNSSKKESVKL